MKYIITCNKTSQNACVNLFKQDGDIKFSEWLDPEIGILEYSGKTPFHEKIIANNFYVRHIFRVDEIADFEHFEQVARFFAYKVLDKNLSFSFQVRKAKNVLFDNEIIFNIAKELEQDEFILDIKEPNQIISVFVAENKIYIGLGNKTENLSKFKGGNYHFHDDENFVSRAEYKLLEANDCFGLDWKNKQNALDLGAAPGGWSKVLAQHFEKVFAIDPAKLDEKVKKITNISHYKMTSQEFLKSKIDIKFDALVNDMKMDMFESIKITNSLAPVLNNGADIIITLKLPKDCQTKKIKNAFSEIEKAYKIITARQLFHNRSEITVYAKKI